MPRFLTNRWFWIVVAFLAINTWGVIQAVSVLEDWPHPMETCRQMEAPVIDFDGFSDSAAVEALRGYLQVLLASPGVPERFEVRSINASTSSTRPWVEIGFSHPVDADNLAGYIEVSPKVDYQVRVGYSYVTLAGDFQPGSLYDVELLKGLPSAEGVPLEEASVRRVLIPNFDPSVSFKSPGLYMSLGGNRVLPLEIMNVDEVEVRVHKVFDNNIVHLLNELSSYSFPSLVGVDVVEREYQVSGEQNQPRELLVDLEELLGGEASGLYSVTVNSKGDSWRSDQKLVMLTDLGVVARMIPDGLLVWVTSIQGGRPVPGALVKVFTRTNQVVHEGVSGADGTVRFDQVAWEGDSAPFVITAGLEPDLSYLEIDDCLVYESEFDVRGRPYLRNGYEAFVYTERGIYRPGEQVHVKGLVRGVAVGVPEAFPVLLRVLRPDGRRFKEVGLVLSAQGGVETAIDLPDHAFTGQYTVALVVPGADVEIGRTEFHVEEYVPPRLRVKVETPDRRFSPAQKVDVKVLAEHYFGAPASNRRVRVNASLMPASFSPPQYKDFSFVDSSRSSEFSPPGLSELEGQSDPTGKARFELVLPPVLKAPSAVGVSGSVTVSEVGGRTVTEHFYLTMDPYPYYLGLRREQEGHEEIGKEVRFEFVAVAPDGKAVNPSDLFLTVCRVAYNQVLTRGSDGRYRYLTQRVEKCDHEERLTGLLSHRGSFGYVPDSWGEYLVRLKGAKGDHHASSQSFYVSGGGDMPWSMERPEVVGLELDRAGYRPGDIAQMVIRSPFSGRALLTCSTDRLLLSTVVNLDQQTSQFSIPVDERFVPNAYCSVTVIRPVATAEPWLAHRAHGVVALQMDNTAQRLTVELEAPDTVKSRNPMTVRVKVATGAAAVEGAELTVAAVDEGILRLTGFGTPDPFQFFWGKRARAASSSDIYAMLVPEHEKPDLGGTSSPSGGAGGDYGEPGQRLNPISAERIKSVALWQGTVVTDQHGFAEITLDVPEFTGALRLMAVAAAGTGFGAADTRVRVADPLMVRASLPRFLASGDRVVVPVSVFNASGAPGVATVRIEGTGGIKFTGPDSVPVQLGYPREEIVRFTANAPDLPGTASVTVSASMGDHKDTRTVELAVRPPVPFTTRSGAGALTAPAEEIIAWPLNWVPGTGRHKLTITGRPELRFSGGLNYLADYPYGCLEQTTSRVFPLLYLQDLAAVVDPERFNTRELDQYVSRGIERLLAMQTYSGGFATWPGGWQTYEWGAIYATDFLVQAHKAGHPVPKHALDDALDYLEGRLGLEESSYDSQFKAYAVYVLAVAGRVNGSWIRRLQELDDKLPGPARFHVAAALSQLGDTGAMTRLLGRALPDTETKRKSGGSLDSAVRNAAVALSVYMDLDPDHKHVPLLVKRLETFLDQGEWRTTQDNSAALVALGKYVRHTRAQPPAFNGAVYVDDRLVAEFDHEKSLVLDEMVLAGNDVRIWVNGTGTAYFYWSASGVPTSGKLAEGDWGGFEVRRQYLDPKGMVAMTDKEIKAVEQGRLLVAELSLRGDGPLDNIVVQDMLPAGFEIENPRLATSETYALEGDDVLYPDRVEMRDDRFLLFADLPQAGVFKYRYLVRAVSEGIFALPPVQGECMYLPGTASIHGAGNIRVKGLTSEL